jgi:hypothetical protein
MHSLAQKANVSGHDAAAWLQHVRDWLPGVSFTYLKQLKLVVELGSGRQLGTGRPGLCVG